MSYGQIPVKGGGALVNWQPSIVCANSNKLALAGTLVTAPPLLNTFVFIECGTDTRRVTLHLKAVMGATNSQVGFFPFVSAKPALPTGTDLSDASWKPVLVTDGSLAAVTLAASSTTGSPSTGNPVNCVATVAAGWLAATYGPLIIRTQVAANASDIFEGEVSIDVTAQRWFALAYSELSATTVSTVTIDYSLGC